MDAKDRLADRAGEFLVRPMQPEDIPAVMAIDRESFPNPWPENTYWYELRENRTAHLLVIQSRENSEVVGVAGYWLVVDEVHISTLAVRPDWRSRGVGTVLLAGMLRQAAGLGATSATLEVRTGNQAAQVLYRKFGFQIAGRRKGYYKDNSEDALLMTADRLSEFEHSSTRKEQT
jgi:[ribosomal protein S18]-alanine N-acetyltransferase